VVPFGLTRGYEVKGIATMTTRIEDTLTWYVVRTHNKQEERANSNLQAWGVETLNPKLLVNRCNQFTGQLSRVVKPLFPGYIFARFRFNDLYHRIRFTRGVHSLVCFNNEPTPVDEEIISLIRSRIGTDGFVKAVAELKAGDEVVINEGRFQKLHGVFEREMQDADADRVTILLSSVNFQAHVVVDRVSVSLISQPKRSRPPVAHFV
jgi:transcriptional antiterminator RfaH